MRFPILTTTVMVSALALGTAAHAQQAADPTHQGQQLRPAQLGQQGQTQQQIGQPPPRIAPQMQDPAQSDFRNLIDRTVIDPTGEQIGEVSDVLIDRDGQVRMIVIEHGGVLGMGNRQVALPIDDIQPGAEGVRIPVSEAQLENMPPWQPSDPIWADWTGLRDNGAYWAGGAGAPDAQQQTQGGRTAPVD